MTIGERIKEVRKAKGMTLVQFSEKIGISNQAVSMIENGKSNPSEQTIRAIVEKFDVDNVWLRTGAGEPEPKRERKDIIDAYVGQLLGGKRTETEEILIELMTETTAEQWLVIADLINKLADKKNTPHEH